MQGELTRLISVGLLDTSGGGSGFAGSLGSKLLTRSLTTSGFTYEDTVSDLMR